MERWHHCLLGAAPKATGLAWRHSVPAFPHASASPFSFKPQNALPASIPLRPQLCQFLHCFHFQGRPGHGPMAPDLFFILPFSGQTTGSTLENSLGKGWAILHFRQAHPGDFEWSFREPFGCGTQLSGAPCLSGPLTLSLEEKMMN